MSLTEMRTIRKFAAALVLSVVAAACGGTPPPKAPEISYDQKMAWILQLEDRRLIKEPEPPPVAAPATGRRDRRAAAVPPPPPPPDLTRIVTDLEPRVRRRAALALGRVGLPEAVPTLVTTLADADLEVRAAAAFALGLIGDKAATAPLVALMQNDASPLVRGRAAEALGQINATDAADAIAKMAATYATHPSVTGKQPDEEQWPTEPEAEAFKLGLFALVRLRAYPALASVVLDSGGKPISTWWPVAYALRRVEDPRAVPALRALTQVRARYTPAFAARGLGASKDHSVLPALVPLLEPGKNPREVVGSAILAVAQLGPNETPAAPKVAEALAAIVADPKGDQNLRLESVRALATLKATEQLPVIQDLLTDDWVALRAEALRAAAAIDPDSFALVLSGLEVDRHWQGRIALADVLATMPPEVSGERLHAMLKDEDKRVLPAVLRALERIKAPDLDAVLREHLKDQDFAVRATAVQILGRLKSPTAVAALRDAYEAARNDTAYDARLAAINALAEHGAANADAVGVIRSALADKDWAVRLRAAELMTKLDPSTEVRQAIRPVPSEPPAPYNDLQLINPPFSPHAFIETAKGTIELELAVLDAPQTARNFMNLARKGFFNGLQVHRVVPNFVMQAGDPRGDGEGGPGYTIRDELNDRPYLRGTVGMALAGKDTGGSQFFITHSPQPHLDARYTVFGHVVNGMDVVDRIAVGDVIQRVRIWDGKSF